MTPAALNFEVFNDRLVSLKEDSEAHGTLVADASLGVGFLLGAGLPQTAAAFAHMAERWGGEDTEWPWRGSR
jgi:hypothetical protein